jgi:dTDP-4-amino-4,6-dideoxygalactose transaminase
VICDEQLRELDKINKRRKEIKNKFNNAFELDNRSLYLYRINVKNRDNFIRQMDKVGIQCGVHFKPLHLMKAFSDVEVCGNVGKIVDNYKTTVSLPFYNRLTNKEVDYIIDNVKKYAHFIRQP